MRETPLYNEHVALGARIVDFNGWALPLQFKGIIQEHLHTRSGCSVFDCSHMGEYRVKGREAVEKYDGQVISDVGSIPLGRGRYGAILNESGGIIDDLITFRLGEDELYVVTNAGPLEAVTERLCRKRSGVENVSEETAKIDVQGPKSREYMLRLGFEGARGLKYFNAMWTVWEGREVVLSRTGYTGELGYEIFLPNELAPVLWRRLLDMEGVAPAGLGARDTLRTEVGYALSGQDFDQSVTPLEAGMEEYIAWETEFVGKKALQAKRDEGDYPVLVGIRSADRRAPRHKQELKAEGVAVGEVTSGVYGPSVGVGVGLARVPRDLAEPGIALTAGPKDLPVVTAKPPFYTGGTCRVKVD